MADGEKTFVIGSRDSTLAVRQSEIVMAYLEKYHPKIRLRLETMKTTGDRILDRRLYEIGGKGLFVKELDQALREGRIDLSVHSMKDMPIETPDDLPVIGCSRREDPRDVLVLPAGSGSGEPYPYIDKLIDYSRPIGTSSRRRILQLQELFPKARFESVRGNLATRLRKLDEGQYSALILAGAGLKRLGLENRINRYFEVDEVVPSACQGILALQGRKGEDYRFLDGFGSRESTFAAAAERAFIRTLGGGCSSPVGAYAEIFWNGADALMTLYGFYYDAENQRSYRKKAQTMVGDTQDCARVGRDLAQGILEEAGKGYFQE